MMHRRRLITLCLIAGCAAALAGEPASGPADAGIDRGRYLVIIGGCNDCHTPGYMQAAGKTPEALWLTGDSLGWRGPWGTTYASNLRNLLQSLSEDQWVTYALNLTARPPMPWFNLRQMREDDLRAIYRYVRYLGPAGQPAPAYVPPDKEPNPPFASFPD